MKDKTLSDGEFRGRVLASLEFIQKEISDIKINHVVEMKELKLSVEGNSEQIQVIKRQWAKATGIASGIGAAAGFVANLIFK